MVYATRLLVAESGYSMDDERKWLQVAVRGRWREVEMKDWRAGKKGTV